MSAAPNTTLRSDTTRLFRKRDGEDSQRLIFGTKAETLERLSTRVRSCSVPALYYFTLAPWRRDASEIQREIRARFGDQSLAVRSSAFHEDSATASMAGAFRSVLNVPAQESDALTQAIEEVFASYPSKHPGNQVLIQPMLHNVAMSGVMMTHDLTNGAPYYIINYDDESGRTDVITGGTGVSKSVVAHRDAPANFIESPRIAGLLEMARELESLCGGRTPLDIEFAQTAEGHIHLLQVRRIAVQKNWNRAVRTRVGEALEQLEQFCEQHFQPRSSLPGGTTLLGQMPDWNPAELIGAEPGPLATSLFRELISDSVWQEGRASMGYRAVPHQPLMITLAGRPYIDVRLSFASFLPSGLPADIESRVVDAWLDRLAEHPEFHDKVEFEVAQTAYDFAFERQLFQRYTGCLDAVSQQTYREALRALTSQNVSLRTDDSLESALRAIGQLSRRDRQADANEPPLRQVFTLLHQCKSLGTLPFSVIARHAFIAEAFLRSAVERRALSQERLEAFKQSLITPAGEMASDFQKVVQDIISPAHFLKRYGHLRPGTFDILSPRYDQREDLFQNATPNVTPDATDAADTRCHHRDPFRLTETERTALQSLCEECQFSFTPDDLIAYAARSIVGREHAKFVFTRPLSDLIESIAAWGECIGLTREDLAYLTLQDLSEALTTPPTRDAEAHFQAIAQSRRSEARDTRAVKLGYIIRGPQDLYVMPQHRGAANFVTRKKLEAAPVILSSRMTGTSDLFGKLVCIECADPGFDWVFAKGIAGLITKFGGANSHMTIRCAELGIPAAIGVGETLFEKLTKANRVELRCAEKVVRPLNV